jgi:Xaa-Pro dipeptidase
MKDLISNRIFELQKELKSQNIDVAVFFDRENLIYFSGLYDLEAGSLVVPACGEPILFCLWLDFEYMNNNSGIEKVIGYGPNQNISQITAEYVASYKYKKIKIGFTRYFISLKDYQCLIKENSDMVIEDISELCYKIRSVKHKREIEYIRNAANAVVKGIDATIKCITPGMKEIELLAEAQYVMMKSGSEGSSFRMQVLNHKKQLLTHPYAGQDFIANNQPVVVHLGATYKGYTAKMCRTVFLGEVAKETNRIYEILIEAQQIAKECIRPNRKSGEVWEKVFRYINEMGYGEKWLSQIGYGVGIRQSEFYPIISKNSRHVLKENMVVDVLLPTIYHKKYGGPRITDTILITKDKNEELTEFSPGPFYR